MNLCGWERLLPILLPLLPRLNSTSKRFQVRLASRAMSIVLTTLNAKYIHCAFGLRYLLANMAELRAITELVEFDINQRPLDVAEILLARNPRIIGFGVY